MPNNQLAIIIAIFFILFFVLFKKIFDSNYKPIITRNNTIQEDNSSKTYNNTSQTDNLPKKCNFHNFVAENINLQHNFRNDKDLFNKFLESAKNIIYVNKHDCEDCLKINKSCIKKINVVELVTNNINILMDINKEEEEIKEEIKKKYIITSVNEFNKEFFNDLFCDSNYYKKFDYNFLEEKYRKLIILITNIIISEKIKNTKYNFIYRIVELLFEYYIHESSYSYFKGAIINLGFAINEIVGGSKILNKKIYKTLNKKLKLKL